MPFSLGPFSVSFGTSLRLISLSARPTRFLEEYACFASSRFFCFIFAYGIFSGGVDFDQVITRYLGAWIYVLSFLRFTICQAFYRAFVSGCR